MSQETVRDDAWDDEEGEGAGEPESVWMWREPLRTIRLPLGFNRPGGEFVREVEIRPMDGNEEDLLVHTEGTQRERASRIDEVLSRCLVRVGRKERDGDNTPKKAPRFFVPELDAMPIQNRVMVVIRLRQLSVHLPSENVSGHKFVFGHTCPHCGKHSDGHSVRLDTLKVEEMPDAFCQEELHTFEAGGHTIEWRTPVGKDGAKISRAQTEAADLLSAFLFVNTVSIDGKKPKGFGELKDLPKAVRLAFKNQLDRGGIDTQITVTCPKPRCKREYTLPLPWTDQSFFFPSGA